MGEELFTGCVEDEMGTECARNRPNVLKIQRCVVLYIVCSFVLRHAVYIYNYVFYSSFAVSVF